jgi:tRNA(fMet)-specific endonuclease VapC
MQFMLDTNICIYIAKKKPVEVLHRFENLAVGQVGMSAITYGSFCMAHTKVHTKKTLVLLEELADLIPPMPIPVTASHFYGQVRTSLEKKGMVIGNNDLWIVSHAMALNVVLVTNNVSEFSLIPHLKIENWTEPAN